MAKKQGGPIMMNVPGEAPKELSNQQVVQLIQQQQQAIQQSLSEKQHMQNNLIDMQKQLIQASLKIQELQDELKNMISKQSTSEKPTSSHVLEEVLDVMES